MNPHALQALRTSPWLKHARRRVVDAWPRLVWRHHGIGALQAYIEENREPEVRVHIWHPSLVRPGIEESGNAHDHRFNLQSTILIGSISEIYHGVPTATGDGAWQIWNVENARSAGAANNFDGVCRLDSPLRYSTEVERRVYYEGETYRQPRATFHATIPTRLAVTLCVMREKRGQARLLVPYGKEPVHAFGGPSDERHNVELIGDAFSALQHRINRYG